MEPVKITETKTWSSIDIYLFSNGQQYSPPRKYHLRAEELQWWENTVSYLGCTHYGSGHSIIDLYTLNGIKVNGPLELINGAAYVAVEPPDPFINAGYEQYLLRASRSWEKRLIQKSAIKPDSKDPKLKADLDVNIAPVKAINDCRESSESSENKVSLILKTPPTKPQRLPPRKPISSTKQIQKKKSSDTYNNAALKRICAEADKIFPCPKKASLRNEAINRKRLSIQETKKNQEKSQCSKNGCSVKLENVQINDKINAQSDTKSASRVNGSNYPLVSCNDALNLRSDTQNKQNNIDGVPDEVQTVISIYHNKESDVPSLISNAEIERITGQCINKQHQNDLKEMNKEINTYPVNDTTLKSPEEIVVQELKFVSSIKQNDTCENERSNTPLSNEMFPNREEGENNLTVNDNVGESKLKDNNNNWSKNVTNILSEKQATDEYIAYMNRGGLLLLRFNIKIKDCKTIINREKNNNLELTPSLINLNNREKKSQVDIDINFSGELLKNSKEQYFKDKSLVSVLKKIYTEDSNNGETYSEQPGIVIFNCACRNYSKIENERNYDSTCECEYEEKNYKAVPKEKLNRPFVCCQCNNEDTSSKESSQNNNQNISSTNGRPQTIRKTNGPRVSYLTKKFEAAEKVLPCERNDNLLNNNTSLRPHNNCCNASVVTKLKESPILEESIEGAVGKENVKSTVKNVCDKAIQTDWSNVLLEARWHSDDNYTFHLPSLCVLKQLNL